MDFLHIRELNLLTTIGVNTWEKAVLQTVKLDLDLGITTEAITELVDTIDYDKLTQQLETYLAGTKTELIETLAEKIAAYLHQNFGVNWLKLSLYKPGALRSAKTVGVTIVREYPRDKT